LSTAVISGNWFFAQRNQNWPAKQTGYADLPREAGNATWRDLRQPCILPQAALRPPMIFGAFRLSTKYALIGGRWTVDS